MKKKTIINAIAIVIALIVVVVCSVMIQSTATVDCVTCEGSGVVSEVSCTDCEGAGTVPATSRYYSTFAALLPPLIAIALALITKEVYSSLFIGILLGGLFVSNWNPIGALDSLLNDGIIAAISGTAGIFMFLVILGIIVALINKAGGSAAFGRWAEVHIKSRVGAMLASFVLGVLIFIDDYFNCLTVGSVMRPVTDRHKISRAKLAYIIDGYLGQCGSQIQFVAETRFPGDPGGSYQC